MPLLTLTTDLGTKDHYLASLKAAIYNQDKDLDVIDSKKSRELFLENFTYGKLIIEEFNKG